MAYQGRYIPQHPEKYAGDTTNIIYRSSWERKFFVYCDTTPGVLRWASEEFCIPYLHPVDGRMHRYFPDVLMEVRTTNGTQTFLIEIKPKAQSELRHVKRKTKKFLQESMTVAINHAKWDAAERFCNERKWVFQVLTEEHLFGKGI